MKQTITLDTSKAEATKAVPFALRRGERNNVNLTVAVRKERRPYDLTGMNAHLVWQGADGKLVGPIPMEVDTASGTVRCTLPDACYSAVEAARAHVELRRGSELVDTTGELSAQVIECIDPDAEQAEEYKPLIGEVRDAIDAANSKVDKAVSDAKSEVAKAVSDANSKVDKSVSDAEAAISEVKATEAKLYPAAENILKGAVKDAFVHVDDAFAGAALREITIEGACKQDGTPSPENPVPIQVIENPVVKVTGRNLLNPELLAANADWCYSADGGVLTVKASDGRAWSAVDVTMTLRAGTYCASGDTIEIRDESDKSVVYGSGAFTLDKETRLKIKVGAGKNTYPYVSKAQIERGSTPSEYKPYASQSLAIALPSEHPYLAKLPDGTADSIEIDREGNAELVARVGMDRNVTTVSNFSQGNYYSLKTGLSAYGSPNEDYKHPVICSAIKSKDLNDASTEGIYRTWTGVYVSDKSERTKEEIQAEVDKNAPLTVVAPIPEKRYQLGKVEVPKLPESTSNVWTDSEVPTSTGVGYVRDVNIVVGKLESK